MAGSEELPERRGSLDLREALLEACSRRGLTISFPSRSTALIDDVPAPLSWFSQDLEAALDRLVHLGYTRQAWSHPLVPSRFVGLPGREHTRDGQHISERSG